MGGAPVVETIRPGVQFVSSAADSFRRLEARLGRPIDVNSTYRDWNTQLRMYNDWMRYVNSGYKPAYKPNHSRAVHPDYSKHCQGLALDSDDWTTPGFIPLAAEYGFIRTAPNDPTEQHHFEYQWWNDKHRNDPVPAGGGGTAKPKEWDEMASKEEFRAVVKEELATALKESLQASNAPSVKIAGIPGGAMYLLGPGGGVHINGRTDLALLRRHVKALTGGEETFTKDQMEVIADYLSRLAPLKKG